MVSVQVGQICSRSRLKITGKPLLEFKKRFCTATHSCTLKVNGKPLWECYGSGFAGFHIGTLDCKSISKDRERIREREEAEDIE